jgi:probable poly-beta-1,6-N-acetyl-D-glucosamine export protein
MAKLTTPALASGSSTGQGSSPAEAAVGTASQGRSHLYEIDVVRALTALCVVGVHVLAFTTILAYTSTGILIQSGIESALHFTREIFLAITAFVMVYGYAGRPFSGRTFWRKRGLGVLLPYIIWSVFYEFVQQSKLPPLQWTIHLAQDLLTGSASFQLYYILLTLEFYLILPWFLRWIQKAGCHPWRLLGISLALQILLLAVDYRYVQVEPFATSPIGTFINLNQTRFLPAYQFYIVIGGLAALYMSEIRAFMLRYGGWTIMALAISLSLLVGNMVYQVRVAHETAHYGISVFQPLMPLYAFAVSAFLYWIAYRWAVSRAPLPPKGRRAWKLLSDTSFGIYLMHAYILNQAMVYLVPSLPDRWLEPLRVALTWLVVCGLTVLLCSILLWLPLLSRLIGRPSLLLQRWQRSSKPGASGLARALDPAVVLLPQLASIRGLLFTTGPAWSAAPGRSMRTAKTDKEVEHGAASPPPDADVQDPTAPVR